MQFNTPQQPNSSIVQKDVSIANAKLIQLLQSRQSQANNLGPPGMPHKDTRMQSVNQGPLQMNASVWKALIN